MSEAPVKPATESRIVGGLFRAMTDSNVFAGTTIGPLSIAIWSFVNLDKPDLGSERPALHGPDKTQVWVENLTPAVQKTAH